MKQRIKRVHPRKNGYQNSCTNNNPQIQLNFTRQKATPLQTKQIIMKTKVHRTQQHQDKDAYLENAKSRRNVRLVTTCQNINRCGTCEDKVRRIYEVENSGKDDDKKG